MSAIPPYDPPVQPFEIPAEEPILPAGESHILPNSYLAAPVSVPAPTHTPEVLEQMRAPNSEQLAQIHALYKAAEAELIIAWWPYVYLRPSEFVTDKPIACTVAHVLAHARGMEKQTHGKRSGGESVAIPNSYATAHLHWVAECSARKKWIEAKKADYIKRKEEKAKWLAEQAVTEAQWDAYVSEARKIWKDAEAYPVPERPLKNG